LLSFVRCLFALIRLATCGPVALHQHFPWQPSTTSAHHYWYTLTNTRIGPNIAYSTVSSGSTRAPFEPCAHTTCKPAPNGVLRDASSAFGVCSACASRDSAVLASPPGSPRAAQGDELRLPRASAAATRNPPGVRGRYVPVCDARKQSAVAWVGRQAALSAQDAGPARPPAQVSSPFPIRIDRNALTTHDQPHAHLCPLDTPRMLLNNLSFEF